jgi:hypothetical protein
MSAGNRTKACVGQSLTLEAFGQFEVQSTLYSWPANTKCSRISVVALKTLGQIKVRARHDLAGLTRSRTLCLFDFASATDAMTSPAARSLPVSVCAK